MLEYSSNMNLHLKVWMDMVTDRTCTDLVQSTHKLNALVSQDFAIEDFSHTKNFSSSLFSYDAEIQLVEIRPKYLKYFGSP